MPNLMTARTTAQEVKDPVSFANYCQQTLGVPYPSVKQMVTLRATLNTFFEQNPRADYRVLARIVDWVRSRRLRPAHAHLVPGYLRYAWAAGVLPELDPSQAVDDDVEAGIARALEEETNPEWRDVLLGARGVATRRRIYEDWKRNR